MRCEDSSPERIKFVSLAALSPTLRNFHPSFRITKGDFEFPAHCSIEDLDWNHMDMAHRPYIHRTYQQSLRIAQAPAFSISLTRVRKYLPFLVQVTDLRLDRGLFYQMFTLFGVLYVHVIIQQSHEKVRVEWNILSHWMFRWMHPWLDRRLRILNQVQNEEDIPVRKRRAELRRRGYRFASDDPDFITANLMTDCTIPPELRESHSIDLRSLPLRTLRKVSSGEIELVVLRESEDHVTVWPSACPHEGGPLESGCLKGREIQCPWHHLKFKGVSLSEGNRVGALGPWEITFSKDSLMVQQRQELRQASAGQV